MPEHLNGPRINERLDELDLSPAAFAERVEISEGYFRNLRNGSDQCSGRLAHRIARELALSIDDVKDQPKKEEPTAPPKRQDTEKTKGPKRPAVKVAA